MEMFIVSAVVTAMFVMSGCMIARNRRYKALATVNRKWAAIMLLCGASVLICDMMLAERLVYRLPLDILLTVSALSSISSTLLDTSCRRVMLMFYMTISLMLAIYYILCHAGVVSCFGLAAARFCGSLIGILCVMVPISGIWLKVSRIKDLMQTGTVWHWLQLAMDVVYPVLCLILVCIWLVAGEVRLLFWVVSALLCLLVFCLGIRILTDSLFALFQRQERRIVESMKLSPMESFGNGSDKGNVYKELYDRIQILFQEEKPFLNGNLTINDVVRMVFSNKVYISRAISLYSGRNFCQYVNYHRVIYSMEYFRLHPETRVADLWPICGFNTVVSFNMAFRLFMGENPSDWCRKEKIRLSRRRK